MGAFYQSKTCKGTMSHRMCSIIKCVLKNVAQFTGKCLCRSLFLNKIASLRPATLLKKRLGHSAFLRIVRNFQEHLFYGPLEAASTQR